VEELGEPGVAQLREIYLYAHFRNTVSAALVEEFARPVPAARAVARS